MQCENGEVKFFILGRIIIYNGNLELVEVASTHLITSYEENHRYLHPRSLDSMLEDVS